VLFVPETAPFLQCCHRLPASSQRALFLTGLALLSLSGRPSVAGQILDLTQKSLEDLMSIEVTSVSKKEQKTSQAAAAVFVISREDIGHSGALNIPTCSAWFPALTLRRSTPANGPSAPAFQWPVLQQTSGPG